MERSDLKEVYGLLILGIGLITAYFSLPSLHSAWLWAGLGVAALGVILLAKSRPGPRERYTADELDDAPDIPLRRELPGNDDHDCTP